MLKVLIVAATDLAPELGRTLLWRDDIERVCAPASEALEAARTGAPRLIVLDAREIGPTLDLVRWLRGNEATRATSIAVLSRSADLADESVLRSEGVNLVLAGEADPFLWDSRLEELLDVPRRLDARIPVHFEVWSRFEPRTEPIEGVALNISLRGLLLETEEPLDIGTNLDLRFKLPGEDEELRAVGRVAREAEPTGDGRCRAGIEILILRGDARERLRSFTTAVVRT